MAKQEQDRVLYVLEVGGVRKQAVIVRDGPATDGAGGDGWYVESWAHCDYSELPESFADSIGLQIWSDASGRPVPTSTIESWLGPEHCDWQSMTFLSLGSRPTSETRCRTSPTTSRSPTRPRAAAAGCPRHGLRAGRPAAVAVPGRQRAFVGTTEEVEVWPRAVQELGCA